MKRDPYERDVFKTVVVERDVIKTVVEYAEVAEEDEVLRRFYSKEDAADLGLDVEEAALRTLYPDQVWYKTLAPNRTHNL